MHPSLSKASILVSTLGLGAGIALMLGAGLRLQPAESQPPVQPAQPETQAESQPEAQPPAKVSDLVGIYDPEAVFAQSARSARLTEQMTQLQAKAQEAMAASDQQTLMQLQAQAQQMQQTEIQAFLADVEAVLPEVAKEAGIKVIAVDYLYLDESLGTPADLTEAVSKKID